MLLNMKFIENISRNLFVLLRYKAAEAEMQKANSDISRTLNELKLVEDDIKEAESGKILRSSSLP